MSFFLYEFFSFRKVRKIAKALGTRMKKGKKKIIIKYERNLRKAVMRILNLQLLMGLCIPYIDYSIVLFDEKIYLGN